MLSSHKGTGQTMRIKEIALARVRNIEGAFMTYCLWCKKATFENLISVENRFFRHLRPGSLEEIYAPRLVSAGHEFLSNCASLKIAHLPKLQAGRRFAFCNVGIEELELPELSHAESHFLTNTENVKKRLILPKLKCLHKALGYMANVSEYNFCFSEAEIYAPEARSNQHTYVCVFLLSKLKL